MKKKSLEKFKIDNKRIKITNSSQNSNNPQ